MAADSSGIRSVEQVRLERPIGLAGGISLVIGGVIGMGIYALIAAVGAQAGSSLWLAFTIAILVSIIGVIPIIQISSAMPRAGAGYLYTSRLLGPVAGMAASYFAVLGGACSTAMVAMGVAGYVSQYLPWDVPVQVIAIILPLIFFLLYLFGLRLATMIQVVLAAHLVVALLVYAVCGSLNFGLSFSVALPQGTGGLIMATVLCYSVCMGFQVIAEMGEEMKNASRNIPLSLLIGGSIVLVLYILVGTVFVNSVPYDFEAFRAMNAPLKETGELFLPAFWVIVLSLGALSAGLTSFNAGAIALPREIFSQARDGIVPAFLGRIHRRTGSPMNAVAAFFLFVVLLLLMGRSIDFYGVMTAVGILLMTAVVSVAAVRLPSRFPERYEASYFRVSRGFLVAAAVISVISSIGFTAIVISELPVAGIIYPGFILAVLVYYYYRVRWLRKNGVDWEERMRTLSGFDEEEV